MAGPDKVLIVGLGSIGQRHLRLARARLPQAQIMVLRHSACDGPLPFADVCTTSLAEAVAFAPDIAIIASPAPAHAGVAAALAAGGANLLVEKPLAATAADGALLLGAVQAAGVQGHVGYNLRQLPSLQLFRREIHAGRIGRLASLRAEVGQYLPSWRPGQDWRMAVSARADLGGGVLLELSHELDYLQWIAGDVAAVQGWMGQLGGLGIDVEDTVHAVVHFAQALPMADGGPAPVAAVNLDFMRQDTTRRCTAIGTQGSLTWDAVAAQVWLHQDGTQTCLFDDKPSRDFAYTQQFEGVLQAVQTGQVGGALASIGQGLATLHLIEAIRQSHAQGGRRIVPARDQTMPEEGAQLWD